MYSQNLGSVWTLFGNSTYEEGVLYALTKERDVKCWAYTHIGNSDVFNVQRL